jgi:indole-3-glycerol phosphate synthase
MFTALNAACIAIETPRRPVRSKATPNATPRTKRTTSSRAGTTSQCTPANAALAASTPSQRLHPIESHARTNVDWMKARNVSSSTTGAPTTAPRTSSSRYGSFIGPTMSLSSSCATASGSDPVSHVDTTSTRACSATSTGASVTSTPTPIGRSFHFALSPACAPRGVDATSHAMAAPAAIPVRFAPVVTIAAPRSPARSLAPSPNAAMASIAPTRVARNVTPAAKNQITAGWPRVSRPACRASDPGRITSASHRMINTSGAATTLATITHCSHPIDTARPTAAPSGPTGVTRRSPWPAAATGAAAATIPAVSATLAQIVEHKRAEVARAKEATPFAELEAQVAQAEPPRNLFTAVTHHPTPSHVSIIAEIKRKSPSAGWIRPEYQPPDEPGAPDPFDPAPIARRYHAAGAAAISCLTDERFFAGKLSYIERIKEAVPIPVLRKDFLIDRWQLWESRAAGADGVLLIAECLTEGELVDMLILAQQLQLTTLLEVHGMDSLLRVRPHVGFPHRAYALLGINNRDLSSMRVDLSHTLRLLDLVEDTSILVSESGISTAADIQRLRSAGVRIMLIGEHLMRQPDPGKALGQLLGRRV